MSSSYNKSSVESVREPNQVRTDLNQNFFNCFRSQPKPSNCQPKHHWRHLIQQGIGDSINIPTAQILSLSFHHPLERDLALQCIALSSGRMDILEFHQPHPQIHQKDQEILPLRSTPWSKYAIEQRIVDFLEQLHVRPKDREESIERILRCHIRGVNYQSAMETLDQGLTYPKCQTQLQILEQEGFRFIHTPQLGARLLLGLHPNSLHIDLGYFEQRPAHHLQFLLSMKMETLRSPYADFINLYEDQFFKKFIQSKLSQHIQRLDAQSNQFPDAKYQLETKLAFDPQIIHINDQLLVRIKETLEIDLLIQLIFETGKLLHLIEAIADVKLTSMKAEDIRELGRKYPMISKLINELSRIQIVTRQKAS